MLNNHFPDCKINFDLEDCDKVLRVEGIIPSPEFIIEVVSLKGYQCAFLM